MGSLFVSRVRERLQRRPTTAASIVEPSAAAIADAAFQLLYDLARQVARQEILLTTAQLRVCSYLNSNHIKPGQIGVFNTYIASLYGNPREVYLLAELNFSAAEYSGRPRLIQLCVQTLGNAIADLNDRSLVHREIDIYEQA